MTIKRTLKIGAFMIPIVFAFAMGLTTAQNSAADESPCCTIACDPSCIGPARGTKDQFGVCNHPLNGHWCDIFCNCP
jgi:hypothetical protein